MSLHGTGRDAADTSIVIMEMLLSMSVGRRCSSPRHGLNSRDIISREGALQLGRSSHDVVTGVVAGRRDDGSLVVGGSVREELQVERVAD